MRFCLLLLLGMVGCTLPSPADVVFLGGRVHTVDAENPSATAVAARDGVVCFVGLDSGAREYVGPNTRVVDLDGATVLPGLTDSHMHLAGVGRELMTLNRMCSNFTYVPSISRPGEETAPWSGATGYVQDLWTGHKLTSTWGFEPTLNNTHLFLCGNPSMIETLLEILKGEGYQEHNRRTPGQIHVEKYW